MIDIYKKGVSPVKKDDLQARLCRHRLFAHLSTDSSREELNKRYFHIHNGEYSPTRLITPPLVQD